MRLRALMEELKRRRDERKRQEKQAEEDTRAPVEKAAEQNPTGNIASDTQKVEQNQGSEFSDKLDAVPDGTSFVIQVASEKKLVGTWKKTTIAGEPFWKKGNTSEGKIHPLQHGWQ